MRIPPDDFLIPFVATTRCRHSDAKEVFAGNNLISGAPAVLKRFDLKLCTKSFKREIEIMIKSREYGLESLA